MQMFASSPSRISTLDTEPKGGIDWALVAEVVNTYSSMFETLPVAAVVCCFFGVDLFIPMSFCISIKSETIPVFYFHIWSE
jgi:hypothetical protein